jgi:hypothetical protein
VSVTAPTTGRDGVGRRLDDRRTFSLAASTRVEPLVVVPVASDDLADRCGVSAAGLRGSSTSASRPSAEHDQHREAEPPYGQDPSRRRAGPGRSSFGSARASASRYIASTTSVGEELASTLASGPSPSISFGVLLQTP